MACLKRILFAGGGTGGHIYMAVALAQELRNRNAGVDFLFVGSRKGLETRILPELGFRLETLKLGGLKNLGWIDQLKTMLRVPGSVVASLRIVHRFRPDVLVGVGGYSSGPVILAGWLMRIPALLIEPNVLPGLTNRILARFAFRIAVAFEETSTMLGPKARLTGIPVRAAFHEVQTEVNEIGPLRLLVFGGSQGSGPINQLVCEALPRLSGANLRFVHQTGSADLRKVREAYSRHQLDSEVVEFIPNMPEAFSRADLVVCRSGASTVAELTAAGKAALLIPFPGAADDHQRRNAEVLASCQAALLLNQTSTNSDQFATLILELERDRKRLVEMSKRSRALAFPESLHQVLKLIEETARS